ncbi:tandem-95 repeat protein [Chitinophaga rupis]|uniref:tandem-95 repeat protein n=1 Tax=Chitinophaga rupis TaxID=573321 RepID=UPI0021CD4326|nr:Ig-like domain-containing protein [Chitinophaga rupis]
MTVTPANDAPVVADVPKTVVEDNVLSFTGTDFTSKFTDTDSDPLVKIQIVTLPTHGTLKLNGTNITAGQEILATDLANITYIPDADFNGADSFSWNGSDGTAYAVTPAAVNITVTPANDAPVVADVLKTVVEDNVLAFTGTDFTSKFTDTDTDPLVKIQIVTLPTHGTLKLNGVNITAGQEVPATDLANITYTPDADFNGSDNFTWNGSDGTAYAVTPAAVNITVTPANDAPVIADVPKTVVEDNVLAFTGTDFTNKFTDTDSDPLVKIQIVTLPTHGTLKLNSTNITAGQEILATDLANITYTPDADFNGADSFNWNGSDGTDYAATPAAVNITVTPANDAPVVADVPKTVVEDNVLAFTGTDFTSKFTDTDSNPLVKIQVVTLPTHGTLKLNGTTITAGQEIVAADLANITYTPDADFNGSDSFTWNGSDGTAYAATSAAVNITVTPANDAPVVADVPKTVVEDNVLTFTGTDFTSKFTDTDSDPLVKIQVVTLPTHGTLKLNGTNITAGQEILAADLANITYTPDANFNGSDNFNWNGSDGTAYAAVVAQVNITVTPANDAPVVADVPKTVVEDNVLAFTGTDFTSKFTDTDNDPLVKIQVVTLPSHGTLKLNGTNITAGQEILATDLANITYTPDADFNGADSFNWNGSDGTAYAVTPATVNITVTPANDAPVVADVPKTVVEDNVLSFTGTDFTSKFTDTDSDPSVKIQIVTLPTHGTLKLNGTNITAGQEILASDLVNITYTPDADFNGSDSFNWNGSDGTAYAATPAAVNITVTPANDAPVIADVPKTVVEDNVLTFTGTDFTSKFTDTDSDPLVKIQIVTLPTHGTLKLNGTNITAGQEILAADLANITYTPDADFNGADNFNLNGFDGTAYAATPAAVNITVTPANDAPVVADVPKTVVEDNVLAFTGTDFTSKFTDTDSDPFAKIQIVTLPTHGTLKINGTNITAGQEILAADLANITYTPDADFNGSDSFNWNGSDGTAYATTPAAVNITVTPANDAPVVADVPKTVVEDNVLAFTGTDFTSKFTDTDNDPLVKIQIATLPTHGTLKLNGTNITAGQEIVAADLANITYTPDADFNGSDNFTWNGSDGTAYAAIPAAVNITITPANDAPLVTNVPKTVVEDNVLAFTGTDFTSKFTDTDNDPLVKIQIVTLPAHGTLKLNGTNITAGQEILTTDLANITYTPDANFNGADSFNWNGSDGTAYAATPAAVNITVTPANDAPVVAAVPKTVVEDNVLAFTGTDFTSKLTDTDSDPLVKIQIVTLPTHGTLKLNGTNITAGQEIVAADLTNITYTPDADFNGSDSFNWNGSDGTAYAATPAAVNIAVTPANDVPVVTDVPKTLVEDNVLAFTGTDFTSKFTDADSDPLVKIQVITLPTHGTLKLNSTNITAGQEIVAADLANITYTPDADFNGSDNFTWNGSDGTAYAATPAAVNITVTPANDAPVIADVPKTVVEDNVLSFTGTDFTSKFTDTDSDPLVKIQIVTLPTHGTLKLTGTNIIAGQEIVAADLANITYTPAADFTGSDNFTWNGSDGTAYAVTPAAVNIIVTPANDAPVIADVPKTVVEDNVLAFTGTDFTTKFTDTDSDPLVKIQIVTLPTHGTLKLNGTNITAGQEILATDLANITYTPDADFNGSDNFNWNGSDGTAYAVTPAAVNIAVTPANDAPAVAGVPKTVVEDNVLSFTGADFTGKFTDTDSDPLVKIQIVTLPTHGTLKLNGTNITAGQEILAADLANITYTPDADFNGADSFNWNGSDGTAYAATPAAVNITVTPANDVPAVADVPKTVVEDNVLTFVGTDFTSKFTDTDSDPLVKIQIVTLPTHGTLKLNGTNITAGQEIVAADLANITYTPDADFNGSDSFNWNGSDGTAYAATPAAVNITVTPANDVPVVADVPKTVVEDDLLAFTGTDFTNKFTDTDSDPLVKIQIVTLPTHGTLKLNGTNITAGQEIVAADLANITYTPDADFNGSDNFNWNGSDGTAYAAIPAAVNITVTPANDAPVVADVPKTVVEDNVLAFTGTDFTSKFTDTDSDPLVKIQIVTLPTHGTLKLNGTNITAGQEIVAADLTNITYTPAADFTGSDNFTWNGSDGTAYAATPAAVNITVTPANDAPAVADIIKTVVEDNTLSFANTDFTGKFTDTDTDPLVKIQIVTLPTHGTLKLNGINITAGQEILAADLANITYTPAANFTGSDSFNWNASDGTAYAATPAAVNITVTPANDAPTGNNDTKTTNEDIPVSGAITGTDTDGDPLTYTKGNNPLHGAVVVNPDGTYTYTPAANYNGPDSFTIIISDGKGGNTTATVNITITPVNDAPTSAGDSKTTQEGTPVSGAVTGTDVDGDPLTFTKGSDPAHGTVVVNPDGTYTYTPAPGYTGPDSFTIIISDGKGGTTTVPVNITVGMANNPAITLVKTGVVRADSISITYTFTITNTGNVTLHNVTVSDPMLGLNKTITGNFLPGASITETTVYMLTQADRDNGSVSNTASVSAQTPANTTITDISGTGGNNDAPTVTVVARSPVAVDDEMSTKVNVPVTIPVLDNDDAGHSTFNTGTVAVITQPQHGRANVNEDGTITYTPDLSYKGDDSFTYQVRDADGYITNVATVKLGISFSDLKVPTLFTPNGDGKNDAFEIRGLNQYAENELVIINRWGNEVFRQKGYQNNWFGEGLNEGTYYYLLRIKKTNGSGWEVLKGYTTLIRAFKH